MTQKKIAEAVDQLVEGDFNYPNDDPEEQRMFADYRRKARSKLPVQNTYEIDREHDPDFVRLERLMKKETAFIKTVDQKKWMLRLLVQWADNLRRDLES